MLFYNLIPLSSVLIKSNIPYRFEERYYAEDYELWLKMLYNSLNIFIINEVLCYDNNSISKKIYQIITYQCLLKYKKHCQNSILKKNLIFTFFWQNFLSFLNL